MSKLPTVTRPLTMDPDLAARVERKLDPLTGPKLARAQDAVRKVYASGTQGSYSELLTAYETAIDTAVAKEKET